MIASDREYWLTKQWAERFEEAAGVKCIGCDQHVHPRIGEAQRAACEGQAKELREQMAAYVRLKHLRGEIWPPVQP